MVVSIRGGRPGDAALEHEVKGPGEKHEDPGVDDGEPGIEDEFEDGGGGPAAEAVVVAVLIDFPLAYGERFVHFDKGFTGFMVGGKESDAGAVGAGPGNGHGEGVGFVEFEEAMGEGEAATGDPAFAGLAGFGMVGGDASGGSGSEVIDGNEEVLHGHGEGVGFVYGDLPSVDGSGMTGGGLEHVELAVGGHAVGFGFDGGELGGEFFLFEANQFDGERHFVDVTVGVGGEPGDFAFAGFHQQALDIGRPEEGAENGDVEAEMIEEVAKVFPRPGDHALEGGDPEGGEKPEHGEKEHPVPGHAGKPEAADEGGCGGVVLEDEAHDEHEEGDEGNGAEGGRDPAKPVYPGGSAAEKMGEHEGKGEGEGEDEVDRPGEGAGVKRVPGELEAEADDAESDRDPNPFRIAPG